MQQQMMRIGALASQAAVNIQTVRYYERRGLLAKPPRTESNYRLYSEDSVRRVRFVKRAQQLGFIGSAAVGARVRPQACWRVR